MPTTYKMEKIVLFTGKEGHCAKGILTANGKKICTWTDDDWGGPMRIDFITPAAEKEFAGFAKTYLSAVKDFCGNPYPVDKLSVEDLAREAVEHMAEGAAEEEDLRRKCKNKVIFSVKDAKAQDGLQMSGYNTMFTENEVARIKKEHTNLVEIINERFGSPLKDGSPEHLAAEAVFYKRDCKTKTVYVRQVKGQQVVYMSKSAYTPGIAAQIRAIHPDLLRIVNESK